MQSAVSCKKFKAISLVLTVLIAVGLMLPMTVNAETTLSVDDFILVEAENMSVDGHVIAEKTETSVKATYVNGTGDDWLAHGGYVNYILRENQKVYVRARNLKEESSGTRQLSVRYIYNDGNGDKEYFFHFPASVFKKVNEYQDIELKAPDIVGSTVKEIVLFGNAAEREAVEVDCIWVDTVSTVDNVIAEAEDFPNVLAIGEKTDNSIIANYDNTGDDWLAYGCYPNYVISSEKKIYVRARTLTDGNSARQFSVRYTYNDGTGAKEYFFHFPASVFKKVNEYQNIELEAPELVGSTIAEIVLFGNATDAEDFEIDCIFDRFSYNSDKLLLEAENMVTDGHIIAEKTDNSLKASYSSEGGDDWLAHGGYVNYKINAGEQIYLRARTLAANESTRQLAVRYVYTVSDGVLAEKYFNIPGSDFPTVGDYYDIPLNADDIMGGTVTEIALFGNAEERIPAEVDCFVIKKRDTAKTILLEAENMNTVDISLKTPSSVYAYYPSEVTNHCMAWGGYMNGYTLNKYDKELWVRAKMLEAGNEVSDVFSFIVYFTDGSNSIFTVGSDRFDIIGEYVDIKLDTDSLHNKPIGEIVLYGNIQYNVDVEIDCFFTTEIVRVGDINIDGFVDIKDIVRLKKYLAEVIGSDAFALKNADMDGDSQAGSSDLILLKNRILSAG